RGERGGGRDVVRFECEVAGDPLRVVPEFEYFFFFFEFELAPDRAVGLVGAPYEVGIYRIHARAGIVAPATGVGTDFFAKRFGRTAEVRVDRDRRAQFDRPVHRPERGRADARLRHRLHERFRAPRVVVDDRVAVQR